MINVDAWLNHWLVANVPWAAKVSGGNQTYVSTRHPLGQELYQVPKKASMARTTRAVEALTKRLIEDLRASRAWADQHFPEIGEEYRRLNPDTDA